MSEPAAEEDLYKELRVLIVDDMLFMRIFISNCIKKSFPGCVCDTASDGRTAIEKLRAQTHNIVLCDWEMPETRGDEVLRWVREESLNKELPFIMVTANNDRQGITKVISLGVTDYVVKPLNCETLSQKIRSALKLK